MERLKPILFFALSIGIFFGVFIFDVIRLSIKLDTNDVSYVHEGLVILASFLAYLFIQAKRGRQGKNIARAIGKLLLVSILLLGLAAIGSFLAGSNQESAQMSRAVVFSFVSFVAGVPIIMFSISTLLTIKDLVLYKRTKGIRRNFLIYLFMLLGLCVTVSPIFRGDLNFLTYIFFGFAILLIVINSFKQNWIVSLSKREKIYSLLYAVFLSTVFIGINLLVTRDSFLDKALVYMSSSLKEFVQMNAIFGAVYFGMSFVTALFQLPTAEVYERKQSELSSLHNLSRLVAQVFDFRDLVNTVTQMTLEVCGASSAWLELFKEDQQLHGVSVEIVSQKNITKEQIESIIVNKESSLRKLVAETKKVMLIDDVKSDHRTKHIKKRTLKIGSLLSVPLLSQRELIGILHATKDIEYGFDQDDIDVLTTFADHVTIAIENAKLIEKSLERERFQQEIMVAQQMQKRLLPQRLPQFDSLELAATSEPSMEVGGDYYDAVVFDRNKLGLVVGDVSGKGVSAAFYMAEVKGIFQSLSKLSLSPREFLIRANETLKGSLERKAFISLLYAIFDLSEGTVHLARAGHCPMIYLSESRRELIRPDGLGLGLTDGDFFQQVIKETLLHLKKGDICLFYTDGLTEARNSAGEEFGYDRLLETAYQYRQLNALEMKENIMRDIRSYTGMTVGDDMTLVVAKWIGTEGKSTGGRQ